MSEHSLPEASAQKLLKSGDVVLANPWEGSDFKNRLLVGGGDDGSKIVRRASDADSKSPPSDLIELTHLHEPSVVHALRYRYESTNVNMSRIYTDTGPILLAVNPFKRDTTGKLYGVDAVKRYRTHGEGRWIEGRGGTRREVAAEEGANGTTALPPHVYAVADRTFRAMMERLHPPADAAPSSDDAEGGARPGGMGAPQSAPPSMGPKANQSVLCSGESGAGKTVTTKLLMAYISKLSDKNAGGDGTDSNGGGAKEEEVMPIEQRILESNPIMESFGNARTVRNDNSSRFGKYIEMKFASRQGRISNDAIPSATLFSASIETYLLEKVRLVRQSPGERNYHIFYELFSAKDMAEGGDEDGIAGTRELAEAIGLRDYGMEDFHLINSSGTYDRRDGVVDADTFRDMKHAMSVMGFDPAEVRAVFEMTAALLHLSNLKFRQAGSDCELRDNPHLRHAVNLLGIDKVRLNEALCYQQLSAGRRTSTYKKVLTMEQCERGVEGLIKATYGAMFEYLVRRINKSIAGDGGIDIPGGTKKAFVGVLDIFGFESFKVNSFEQLCINYCNESLQQQFNGFVLRREQEEYEREGIPWGFVEFPENQDVLDLIDAKGSGILHILHDMSRAPGASDKSFALAMYSKCSSNRRFEADSRQLAQQLFAINHYAGLVEYDVEGFVEKTKDDLPQSGIDLLLFSTNSLATTLGDILRPPTPPATAPPRGRWGGSGAAKRPTVGIQFSSQLQSLRKKIDDTSPHYIRCLKPNNLLVPDKFDAALIADQLRSAGIIEAVRVSRLGYPQRFSHGQFIARYRLLGKGLENDNTSATELLNSIEQRLDDSPDFVIQVGTTKVFMRRQAYDLLEKMRGEEVTTAATTIQKHVRRLVREKSYTRTLHAFVAAQSFVRKALAAKKTRIMREQRSSNIIQRSWRRYVARKQFILAKIIARWCQTHWLGFVCRREYNEMVRERKALLLQSRWRGHRDMTSYRKHINAVLVIQCAMRCRSARVALRTKRAEARDLTSVVQERDKMRQELIILQDELQKMKDKTAESDEKETEIQSLRTSIEQFSRDKDSAASDLKKVNNELEMLKAERDLVADERDEFKQANLTLQNDLNSGEKELQTKREDIERSNLKINTLEAEQVAAVIKLAESEGKIQEAMNSITQLTDEVAFLQIDNDVTAKLLNEKEKSLDDAQSTILSLNQDSSQLSDQMAELHAAKVAAEERVRALEVNLQSEQVAAAAKLSEVEDKLASLYAFDDTMTSTLAEKEAALEEIEANAATQREELLAIISELRNTNAAAEEQSTALEGKLQAEQDAATAKLAVLEGKLNAVTDQVASLQNANDVASKLLNEKEMSLGDAKSTILSLKEDSSQLSDQVAELHAAKVAAEERASVLEVNLLSEQVAAARKLSEVEASREVDNEAMARTLAEKEAALEEAQAGATTQREESLAEISELRNAKAAAEEQSTALKGKFQAEQDAAAAKRAALEGKLNAVTDQVASLLSDNDAASKLLNEKETLLDDAKSTILSLKEDSSQLSDQVTELLAAKVVAEEHARVLAGNLHSEKMAAAAKLADLEGELASLKVDHEAMARTLAEKESALKEAHADAATQREKSLVEKYELQNAKAVAEELSTAATEKRAALEVKLNAVTAQVVSLKNSNYVASKLLNEKETSLEDAQTTILSLKMDTSQLSDQVAELRVAKMVLDEQVSALEGNLQSEQVAAASKLADNETLARTLAEKEAALEEAYADAATQKEELLAKISELRNAKATVEEQSTSLEVKLRAEQEAITAKFLELEGNLKETADQVASLLSDNDAASKLLNEKEASLEDAQTTILSLREDSSRLSAQVTELRVAKMALEERISALEDNLQSEQVAAAAKLAGNETMARTLAEKEAALEEAQADAATQKEELLAKISELRNAKVAAEKESTALERSLRAEQDAAAAKLSELESKLKETTDQVASLLSANDAASKLLNEKEASLDGAQTTIFSLKENEAALEEAQADAATQKEESLAEISELRNAKAVAEKQFTALEVKLRAEEEAAAAKLSELEGKLIETADQVASLLSVNDVSSKLLNEKEASLDGAQTTILSLKEKEAALEESLADAATQKEVSLAEISELRNAKAAAEKKSTALEGEVRAEQEAAAAKLAEFEGKLKETADQVASLLSANDVASKLLNEKEASLDGAQTTILSLKENNSQLSAQVTELHDAKMAVEERMSALEDNLQSEQVAAAAKLAEVEGNLVSLKGDKGAMAHTLAEKEAALEEFRTDADRQQEELLAIISELRNAKAAAEEQSTALEGKLEAEREAATAKLAVLEGKLNAVTDEVASLQNANDVASKLSNEKYTRDVSSNPSSAHDERNMPRDFSEETSGLYSEMESKLAVCKLEQEKAVEEFHRKILGIGEVMIARSEATLSFFTSRKIVYR